MKHLIIPDVHGRSFYKSALENKKDKIVFLGDYVDPYPQEGFVPKDGVTALEEIIDFKKANKDRVILLMGNHDCGYIWPDVCSSRRSKKYCKDIYTLFNDNFDLFDLAYQYRTDKNDYLFTHAGLHRYWFDKLYESITGEKVEEYGNEAEYLNYWFHCDIYDKSYWLGVYSYFRGYVDCNYGSCVWADVREWDESLSNLKDNNRMGYYQIFGHTQLSLPIIRETYACLDVCKIFTLENDNIWVE